MLTFDKNKRPNANEVLDHPWFKDDISKLSDSSALDATVLENFKRFSVLSPKSDP